MSTHTDPHPVTTVEVDDPWSFGAERLDELSDGLRLPVHLKGGCAGSAADEWTLQRLLGLEPDVTVTAEYYADGDRRKAYERVDKTFAEIAAAMASEPDKWFLAEKDLDQVFRAAAADLPPLPYLPHDATDIQRLVFFGNDTQSATHFHVRDQAILAHLRGDKTVILAGPRTTKQLATNPPFGGRPQFSTHGPETGEDALVSFRRLVGDEALRVEVAPGDALFIPIHWWHWVEGRGECLSVTTFWRAKFSDWAFPHPGIRAATAVALGETAKIVRGVLGRFRD